MATTTRQACTLAGLLAIAGCAAERPPMNPDDPGTVRPMRQEVYQQTFPPGGTPAQGLRVGEPPVNAVPPNAPVNQPGNRP